jgi:phosphoenolpyruvate carboxylase
LSQVGANRLADNAVWPVRRALDVFGFHLAALDIRQNSKFHEQALVQILAAMGQPAADFGEREEARRLDFLNQELQSPRPFLYDPSNIGEQAEAVLSRTAFSAGTSATTGARNRRSDRERHAGFGSLVVYLLAREAGLMR